MSVYVPIGTMKHFDFIYLLRTNFVCASRPKSEQNIEIDQGSPLVIRSKRLPSDLRNPGESSPFESKLHIQCYDMHVK